MLFGRYDEANVAIEKAKQLGAPDFRTKTSELLSHVLQEHWDEARAMSQQLMAIDNPSVQWQAGQMTALIELYEGNTGNVLSLLEQAASGVDEQIPWATQIHNFASYIRLERGELEEALEEANKARLEENNPSVRREGLARAVLASAKLERFEEAQALIDEYRQDVEALPTHTGMRRYHYLSGELALSKGEPTRAIEELAKAESMLLPRAWGEEHPAVWFALGQAHLEAGEESEAARWFQKIVDSTTERFSAPITYIRSLYFLGHIHENRGETELARSYYQRFLDYWEEGDIDRERIESVQPKLT
jgi:tetratricopeptide (TPR) repeat protein